MSQLVIGLTGGIASGKTTVANIFADYGVDIVDADIVAREVVACGTPTLAKIAEHFGPSVICGARSLNRSVLRQLIFSNSDHKQWLNDLLHPLIRQEITQQLKLATSPYCLLVAPLLIENNMQNMVSRILVVDSVEQTQVERTMQRDSTSEQQVKSIIAAQASRSKRLTLSDDIIENNGTINGLTNDVKKLHDKYTALIKP